MDKKITLTVGRKIGRIYLSNGIGQEWKMTGVDEKTAIASLVYFTLFSRFDITSMYSDNFKIEISISTTIE